MIEDSIKLYNNLTTIFQQEHTIHIDCVMVDAFARAGRFTEAEEVINGRKNIRLWCSLLGGCRKFNNIELGEKVFGIVTSIDEKVAAVYILLSHIYAFCGLNEKADKIRQLMTERNIKKIPSIVYHEENGKLFQFISGSEDYIDEIEKMREVIFQKIIKAGYIPDSRWVTDSGLTIRREVEITIQTC